MKRTMTAREFQVACSALDDHRKLVAVLKSQRWEIVKWAVSLNVALATASFAMKGAGQHLFSLSAGVAFISLVLVLHYNSRLNNTRTDAVEIQKYLMARRAG
jgi:hypothetical protein